MTVESKSVLETLNNHVSIRKYIEKSIPDDLILKILNSARRSPTSSNLQAYSIIVIKDQNKKDQLAILAGNQDFISETGVFLAICADINKLETATKLHQKSLGKNLENTLVSIVDASLVGMSISTAAESVGLGVTMIGGMRNNPREVIELLELPKGVFVVFGMAIGWPDKELLPKQKPRLPEEAVIHFEKYHNEGIEELLIEYDKQLSEHYQSENRNTPDHAWTGIIASRFDVPRRPELRSILEDNGFKFD
jgi:FMN reductase (NADPH)